jgi:hypothetical protein
MEMQVGDGTMKVVHAIESVILEGLTLSDKPSAFFGRRRALVKGLTLSSNFRDTFLPRYSGQQFGQTVIENGG